MIKALSIPPLTGEKIQLYFIVYTHVQTHLNIHARICSISKLYTSQK